MNRLRIIICYIFGFMFAQNISGCIVDVDSISKIEISYVDFMIMTFVDIHCERFPYAFSEIKKHKVITDSTNINYFVSIIKNLQIDTNDTHNIDTRATVNIIKNNNDTLHYCVDMFNTMLNNSVYFYTSKELRNFIENEKNLSNVSGGGRLSADPRAELQPLQYGDPDRLSISFTKFAHVYFNDIANMNACIRNDIEYPAYLGNLPDLRTEFKDAAARGMPDKLYYFHSNHLGSASLVTDNRGGTYQALHFTPFGCDFIDIKQPDWYNEMNRFTGYYKDFESGMDYANARYRDIDFKSPDDMWHLSPDIQSYHYCSWNPIMYRDPDGNFKIPIHGDITTQAIAKSNIGKIILPDFNVNLLFGATIRADILGAGRDFHFDGKQNYAEVQSCWNTLNSTISKTISNIGSFNKRSGGYDVMKLGRLLHNVQDFYAHSNYAELYIEYYQGVNGGALPASIPIYNEGIKNSDFNNLLKEKLRTGDFNIFDNETIDVNPFKERANSPTSHNHMNKDKANTYAGKLAKQAAIEHSIKILEEVK